MHHFVLVQRNSCRTRASKEEPLVPAIIQPLVLWSLYYLATIRNAGGTSFWGISFHMTCSGNKIWLVHPT